jgi:hypothetical protein
VTGATVKVVGDFEVPLGQAYYTLSFTNINFPDAFPGYATK